MSDSFADLWSASAPAKPKPQTLSSAISSSSAPNNRSTTSSKPDVFALLAGSGSTPGSGTSTPRYGTGLGAPAIGGSRPITPSLSTLSTAPTTIGRQTTPQPQTQPQSIAKTGSRGATDAFGDLFAPSSTTAGSGNMTLAARLAMEAQRKGSSAQLGRGGGAATANVGGGGDASAWAGLDALSGGLTATPAAGGSGARTGKAQGVVVDDVDDWGLSDFGSSAATVQAASRSTGRANGAGVERQKPKAATNLWDLDDFASSTTSASTSISGTKNGTVHSQSISTAGRNGSRAAHKERLASPDEEFDFGGREDRVDEARWQHQAKGTGTDKLLDLFDDDYDGPQSSRGLLDSQRNGQDEDDVLGMLSKPVASTKTRYTPSPEPYRQRPSPPASAPRPPSPPPHILGQIVEMGFSIQQARAALAQTATGLDVPAAIDSLLNGTSNSSPAPSTTHSPPARAAPHPEAAPPRPRGVPKGQKERERERLERQRTAGGGEGSGTSTPSVADLQEQADKLLAQASEIGLSVFSKASAMWGKGREKVVKAYEERAGASPPLGGDATGARGGARAREGGGRAVDGRPKWMQEAVGEEYREEAQQGGFRDDDDGDGDVVFDDGGGFTAEQTRPAQVVKPPHHEEEVDLFSDAPVAPRIQTQTSAAAALPSTRPKPHQARPIPGRQQSASSSRSTPAPAQPIPPAPERTLPTASPAALAAAQQHKTTGTAQFKLGQHAAAADAYTLALRALPAGHLLRVPLYTNRALARIRCGEYKAAEEDCARALGVVLDDAAADEEDALGLDPHAAPAKRDERKSVVWTPAALPPSLIPNAAQTAVTAWAHPQGRGVDLADGYVKALRRRAEALEGREKWAAAASDWEVLAGCAWAGESVRKDAMRGRSRCKGMMDDPTASVSTNGASTTTSTSSRPKPTPVASKPKPRPPPAPSAPAAPSQALRALQSQNAQAEADESLKDSLKDSVDARLAGWRQGREGNIRALLVGLDVVLWDTALEGVRVRGLHELLSPAQVKKGYVRVIARVHPDKLNSSNSTVEQRMLANGVFGTLNEAWIAFQATQK